MTVESTPPDRPEPSLYAEMRGSALLLGMAVGTAVAAAAGLPVLLRLLGG